MSLRLGYGFGAVANGVLDAGLSGAVLQLYLNQVLGLPALKVGAIIMVSLIADALIDPLIGQWSDRIRSPWGRRHPFMYASAVPVALSFYLLWNAPAGLSGGALLAFTLALMVTVRIASSFYRIPGDALLPELTSDYDERTTLTSYRWFFGIVGGNFIGYVLNAVFLRTSAQNPLGVLSRPGYAHFGLLGAGMIFVSVLGCALATHRRPKVPLPPRRSASLAQSMRDIRITLSNRSLLALLLGGVLGGIGGGISLGLGTYMLIHFWGLDPGQYAPIVVYGSVGAVLAVFVAPLASMRFGKKRAVIGLFSCSVVTATGPILLRLLNVITASSSGWITVLVIADSAFTAVIGVAGFILVGSMLADVVEDVAVKTGVRSEGLLYATNGLLLKFTSGIGAFIAGVLLTLVNFPAHALRGTVPHVIVQHLVEIYLPVSVTFSVASIAVLGFYNIDRTTQERNAEALHDPGTAAPMSAAE